MTRFPKMTAAGLGLLSAIGFAPIGWWPVTLICLAVLIVQLLRAARLKSALAQGYWFGWGHFVVGLNWIAGSFHYQETMPEWYGWIAVILLSFYLAVFPALAAGLAWVVTRGKPLAFALCFAAAWIVTEWLRATLFTGFAWNPLGVILVDRGSCAQVIGTYGLSGCVALLAGGMALIVDLWSGKSKQPAWQALWPKAAFLPGVVLVMAFAGFATNAPLEPAKPAPLIHIIQPNIGEDEKHRAADDPVLQASNFAKLQSLSGNPGSEARLILWPEAATPDFLEEEEWARAKITDVMGPKDVIITGGVALVYDQHDRLTAARNSAFAMTADAKIIGRYDKSHLVPGGEYLPMRPLLSALGLSRLVPGDLDFMPGPGPQSMALPGFGKVGLQICYEIVFSGQVVSKADRPDFLFNPSNDAWFGPWGPPQHLAQARLRAMEEGMPIVRSTPTGISAVIDANGRVVKALPYQQQGLIETRLPPVHAPTLFALYGNVVPMLLAALLGVLGGVAGGLMSRKPRLPL